MQCLDALTAPEMPNPHGVSARPVYTADHTKAVHITLQPGESIPPHAPPVDVFFYILEGQGRIVIGDESAPVSRDTVVSNQAGVPNGVVNDSDKILRVLVVKALSMAS